MANAEQLSEETRNDIVLQIARRQQFRSALAAPGGPATSLGESLKLNVLPFAELADDGRAMKDRVQPTGLLHHQLYRGKNASQFARSAATLARPSGQQVVEVVTSPITSALQHSIEWVDANVPQEAEAELISVPEFLLTGLWLHGPEMDAVVVSSMANASLPLKSNSLIDAQEFVRILGEQKPIQGLGPRPTTGTQLEGGAE